MHYAPRSLSLTSKQIECGNKEDFITDHLSRVYGARFRCKPTEGFCGAEILLRGAVTDTCAGAASEWYWHDRLRSLRLRNPVSGNAAGSPYIVNANQSMNPEIPSSFAGTK
jgi:hypothetical protein